MPKQLRALLFGGPSDLPWAGEIGWLVLRVAAGLGLALVHGWGKLSHETLTGAVAWGPKADFIAGVAALGFPLPTFFAWCAALAEFAGALLVAIGFLTRPAALVVVFNMSVALFLVHQGRGFGEGELAMLYGSIMLAFCLVGAGRVSVDRALR